MSRLISVLLLLMAEWGSVHSVEWLGGITCRLQNRGTAELCAVLCGEQICSYLGECRSWLHVECGCNHDSFVVPLIVLQCCQCRCAHVEISVRCLSVNGGNGPQSYLPPPIQSLIDVIGLLRQSSGPASGSRQYNSHRL